MHDLPPRHGVTEPLHNLPSRRGATRPLDNNSQCQPFEVGHDNYDLGTNPLHRCAQVRRVCVSPVRVQRARRTIPINPLHDVVHFNTYGSSEIYGRTSCPAIRGSVRLRSRIGRISNTMVYNVTSSACACISYMHTHRAYVHEPQARSANDLLKELERSMSKSRAQRQSHHSIVAGHMQNDIGNATSIASLSHSQRTRLCV